MTHNQYTLPPAVIALAAVAALSFSTVSAAPPLVPAASSDPYAACADATSLPHTQSYPGTAVEPQIALDPRTSGTSAHLVGVWQQDRWDQIGGSRGIVGAVSHDGGRSWTQTILPLSHCAPSGLPYDRASDPWVSIGPDGTVYASALGLNVGPNQQEGAVEVAVSHDGGLTWSHVQTVPGQAGGSDKEAITADPRKPGVAYLVWSGDDNWFSMTANGGKSWSVARRFAQNESTTGNQILVNPKTGALDDLSWSERGWHHTHLLGAVQIRTSHNNGKSWSAAHTIALTKLGSGRTQVTRAGQVMASFASDGKGHLYAAWADGRFSHGHSDGIAFVRSADGRHWSRPILASAPAQNAETPTVAVDWHGDVGLTYYTLPVSGPPFSPARAWFALLPADAHSFQKPIPLGPSFDPADAPQVGGNLGPETVTFGPFLGDYEGLAAGKGTFYPFFAVSVPGSTEPHTIIESTQVPVH